jgi:hypothetical protein
MAEMNEASLAFWLSKFVGFREFRVMCNQNESVVSPVFNNCNITFRLWGVGYLLICQMFGRINKHFVKECLIKVKVRTCSLYINFKSAHTGI